MKPAQGCFIYFFKKYNLQRANKLCHTKFHLLTYSRIKIKNSMVGSQKYAQTRSLYGSSGKRVLVNWALKTSTKEHTVIKAIFWFALRRGGMLQLAFNLYISLFIEERKTGCFYCGLLPWMTNLSQWGPSMFSHGINMLYQVLVCRMNLFFGQNWRRFNMIYSLKKSLVFLLFFLS